MAKIPFDIKYRPEIESGKYKVKVEEHEARIVCWDYNGDTTLIVLVKDISEERAFLYDATGRHKTLLVDKMPDLELYTDEPEELTEFEKAVKDVALKWYNGTTPPGCPNLDCFIMSKSEELLALAKTQLKKEFDAEYKRGYEDCKFHVEERISKAHLEGFAKGQELADKRNREANSFHFPMYGSFVPPCYLGGPCTNPHHDCINCPFYGSSGNGKTDTKV